MLTILAIIIGIIGQFQLQKTNIAIVLHLLDLRFILIALILEHNDNNKFQKFYVT